MTVLAGSVSLSSRLTAAQLITQDHNVKRGACGSYNTKHKAMTKIVHALIISPRLVNKEGLMVDLMQLTPPYIFKTH